MALLLLNTMFSRAFTEKVEEFSLRVEPIDIFRARLRRWFPGFVLLTHCPIAYALRRVVGGRWQVTESEAIEMFVRPFNIYRHNARKFVFRFDDQKAVDPSAIYFREARPEPAE